MGDAASGGTDMLAATGGAGLPSAGDSGSSGGFSKAGGLSIASLGLSAFSGIEKAQGTAAADEFQVGKAERAADFGRLQAGLTDSVMREQLNTTLSNIDVIRAASRTDPTSPTGAAIESYDSKIANRQRTTALLNINAQVSEDEASASYLHKAGLDAVANANLNAGLSIPTAVAKAMV